MEFLTLLPLAILIALIAVAVPVERHLKTQRPDIAKNLMYFCGGFIACHLLEMVAGFVMKGHW